MVNCLEIALKYKQLINIFSKVIFDSFFATILLGCFFNNDNNVINLYYEKNS